MKTSKYWHYECLPDISVIYLVTLSKIMFIIIFHIIWCDNSQFPHNKRFIEYYVYIVLSLQLYAHSPILEYMSLIFRSILFLWMCMRSSIKLHNEMFSNILTATMRFFDTNPSGRILNRFSKDMGVVDEILPRMYLDSIQVITYCYFIMIIFCKAIRLYLDNHVYFDYFYRYLW